MLISFMREFDGQKAATSGIFFLYPVESVSSLSERTQELESTIMEKGACEG